MGLKEKVIKDIDGLGTDELVALSEQIRLLKRTKGPLREALPVEEILKLTAASKSVWSEDIALERSERG